MWPLDRSTLDLIASPKWVGVGFTIITIPLRTILSGLTDFGLKVIPVFLVFISKVIEPQTLGWCLGWCLYAYAIYSLLPTIYPNPGGERLRNRKLIRGAMSGAIVVFAAILARELVILETELATLTGSPLPPVSSFDTLLSFSLITCYILILASISLERDVLFKNGPFRSMWPIFDKVSGNKTFDNLSKTEDTLVKSLDTVISVAVVVYVLALATIAAGLLFPVVELTFIFAIGLINSSRTSWTREKLSSMDIESRLLSIVKVVQHGPKGIISLLLLIIPLGIVTTNLLFVLIIIPAFISTVAGGSNYTSSEIAFSLIGITGLSAFSFYSFWYWYRIIRRLPYYLEEWDNLNYSIDPPVSLSKAKELFRRSYKTRFGFINSEVERVGDDSHFRESDLPTRPPGALLQPSLLYLLISTTLRPDAHSVVLTINFIAVVFFVYWSYQSVRWTQNSPAQQPIHDNTVITVAHIISFLAVSYNHIYNPENIVGFLLTLVSGTLLFAVLFYLPDIGRSVLYDDEDVRRGGIRASAIVSVVFIIFNIYGQGIKITLLLSGGLAACFIILYLRG